MNLHGKDLTPEKRDTRLHRLMEWVRDPTRPEALPKKDQKLFESPGGGSLAVLAATALQPLHVPALSPADSMSADTLQRYALPSDLLLPCATPLQLDRWLETTLYWLLEVVPNATEVALLLKERTSTRLLLRVYLPLPVGAPAIHLPSAQQAMDTCEGVIWRRGAAAPSASDLPSSIAAGLYVPLLWQDEALGVVGVHTCKTDSTFTSDDLRIALAVAHYAAMVLAHDELQARFQHAMQQLHNFEKIVGKQVSDRVRQQRGRLRMGGGEYKNLTLLFSDVRGFTALSKRMSPDEVTDMLEDYFKQLVPIILSQQGTIDKYIGDAIFACFHEEPGRNSNMVAIQAALAMQDVMRAVNTQRTAEGKCTVKLGLGIHYGEVVHGFVGTDDRMEFTAIGDAVNHASRICDGAGCGEVLITPEVFARVWEEALREGLHMEPLTIGTKHPDTEGDLKAYRVTRAEG